MTRIVHLIAHDLRTHRHLLLAWVVIIVLHPLLALVSSVLTFAPMLIWFAVLLVVARLTVGAIVLGVVFQADSPLERRDRVLGAVGREAAMGERERAWRVEKGRAQLISTFVT